MVITLRVVEPVTKTEFDPTWNVAEFAKYAPPHTWERAFADAEPELETVAEVLADKGEFYPKMQDVFKAFELTPLDNVKVVIVGQDPYHQAVNINGKYVPRATGLSFSVNREDSVPVSLQNIFQELNNSVGVPIPDHGDLTEWARQGVLMLNTSLTVAPNAAGSHKQIWFGFINKIVKAIEEVNPNCIYVMWGKVAQGLSDMLGEKVKKLTAPHPSGFSARTGFFGCNHFAKINEMLKAQNRNIINWNLSSTQELRNVRRIDVKRLTDRSRRLKAINVDEVNDAASTTMEQTERKPVKRMGLVNIQIPHAVNSLMS